MKKNIHHFYIFIQKRIISASSIILLTCLLSINPFPSFSQWAWMHGDSVSFASGSFGVQGVTSPSNKPPSVYEPCEWKDHQGNFWMLGGDTYNSLWKYDPVINQWTWMHGSPTSGQPGSYGTQGVPSPLNNPGGRQAATSWVDNDGNLWLFGGYGFPAAGFQNGLNDLWKYDISINEWTWIAGPITGGGIGVYGTQGVPDPSNIPGARLESAASWVDSNNNLWFFGGQLCCTAFGFVDDLWKYDISSGEWTWMNGSSSGSVLPVYGTLGIPDPSNTPGGRRIYSHWKDNDGNFYIFGGQDNTSNCFNDLWKYDPVINQWTWINGSNSLNSPGNFGTSCIFDSINTPGARMENRFYWTDSCNNFWTFGGLNTFSGEYRNDLWCYNPTINQWKWVSGAITAGQDGQYGTQGVASTGNHPGARYGGVSWVGPGESLWLFGGVGFPYNTNVGSLNDLWRFIPDSSCVYCNIVNFPTAAFQSSDTSVCEKFCIDFFDLSSNDPTSWLWKFPGGIPDVSTEQNPTAICYNTPGTYDVTLITTNAFGSDTLLLTNFITVNPTPPSPAITQTGYTLTSSPASSYQWQFNSVDIPGATNQSFDIQQSGYYSVLITDVNGCITSGTTYVLIEGIEDQDVYHDLSIYPNPNNGNFIIEWANANENDKLKIEICNSIGQIIYSEESVFFGTNNYFRKELNLRNDVTPRLSEGIYFITLTMNDRSIRKKVLII